MKLAAAEMKRKQSEEYPFVQMAQLKKDFGHIGFAIEVEKVIVNKAEDTLLYFSALQTNSVTATNKFGRYAAKLRALLRYVKVHKDLKTKVLVVTSTSS